MYENQCFLMRARSLLSSTPRRPAHDGDGSSAVWLKTDALVRALQKNALARRLRSRAVVVQRTRRPHCVRGPRQRGIPGKRVGCDVSKWSFPPGTSVQAVAVARSSCPSACVAVPGARVVRRSWASQEAQAQGALLERGAEEQVVVRGDYPRVGQRAAFAPWCVGWWRAVVAQAAACCAIPRDELVGGWCPGGRKSKLLGKASWSEPGIGCSGGSRGAGHRDLVAREPWGFSGYRQGG